MGRHSGKNLKVSVGGTFIDGCVNFKFNEQVPTHDLTAAGDSWEDHDTGIGNWGGTIAMRLDHGADGQDLRAGDEIVVQGYTEGDGTGKTYVHGTATVTDNSWDAAYDGVAAREYSIKGKGALSTSVVA
ncbi:hypothetical protein [Shimia aestuarii]|uniref:hypothetical protein n=1 Tax=Shimia aestuarii TaxID=254406 RepID=UPI001FB409B3|nr:hypothetical protein [Shimia aestuarii]